MPRITALCVAMLALLPLALCQNCPTPGGITIDSSIRIFTDIDWKYGCHGMLAAAKAQGGSKINFIPTHFFYDLDDDLIPNSYALRAGKGLYLPPTPELLEQYTAGMTACFKKAVTLGFTWIEVTPHLDDGDSVKALWRNKLRADPFEPYGGTSYVTALIDPLIKALVAAVPAGVKVFMSIQGEMNGVLIHEPAAWLKLVTYMRTALGKGAFDAQIGINNNFNKICDECPVETNWAPVANQFDLPTIGLLYDAADFIAISAYAPQDVDYPALTAAHMELSITIFAKELSQFGISLTAQLRKGKGFHYSEFGIGGAIGDGSCPQECPCKTPAQVAKYPFQGIGGPYNPDKNPWLVPGNRDYMRRYYRVATQFAAKGTGGKYKVDCIFIWNSGSYDIQALYAESTIRHNGAIASYKDEVVSNMILKFNTDCVPAVA